MITYNITYKGSSYFAIPDVYVNMLYPPRSAVHADLLIVPIAKVLQNGAKYEHAPCSTCRKMLHALDGKMLPKVGEQCVLKQSNMSQNCANFQFLHMRFLHNICAIVINQEQPQIYCSRTIFTKIMFGIYILRNISYAVDNVWQSTANLHNFHKRI